MVSTHEAGTLIRGAMRDPGIEHVPLSHAVGRVLRQAVRAERDQPPYDRVMMDGIALRLGAERGFTVAGQQRAGAPPLALPEGAACLEVMTGAVLPQGADTVIPVERLTRDGDCVALEAGYEPGRGQFIHRRGADCKAGDLLLEPGLRLNAPALGAIAGNGLAEIAVARRQRLAVLSTGDELVPVSGPVRQWEIRRSNECAVAAALTARGFTAPSLLWAPDALEPTVTAIRNALAENDVLILSGGVSKGRYDYVPEAMERLGVRKIFHRVAQRPGGPMWFGTGPDGQAVFALPGNPVAAMCCCVRHVIPALLDAQGLTRPESFTVALAEPAAMIAGLARFLPVRLDRDAPGMAVPAPVRTSGDYSHLGGTSGFVELPPGTGDAPQGTRAVFHGW